MAKTWEWRPISGDGLPVDFLTIGLDDQGAPLLVVQLLESLGYPGAPPPDGAARQDSSHALLDYGKWPPTQVADQGDWIVHPWPNSHVRFTWTGGPTYDYRLPQARLAEIEAAVNALVPENERFEGSVAVTLENSTPEAQTIVLNFNFDDYRRRYRYRVTDAGVTPVAWSMIGFGDPMRATIKASPIFGVGLVVLMVLKAIPFGASTSKDRLHDHSEPQYK